MTIDYSNFDWIETFMIDEVPSTDVWENFATSKKLELEQQYRNLNMPKECSKHYMALNPDTTEEIEFYLNPFSHTQHHYNFLKLTPGYNLWWHYDSYSTFVRYNNITEEHAEKINRTIVMLTPWEPGQVLQIGSNTHTNWNIGDAFTWNSYTWHGVGNFSFTDFVVMQITWLKNE